MAILMLLTEVEARLKISVSWWHSRDVTSTTTTYKNQTDY